MDDFRTLRTTDGLPFDCAVELFPASAESSHSVGFVPSPCVNICELDTDFVCKGCGRSIEEILKWREYTIEQQTAVIDRIFNDKG